MRLVSPRRIRTAARGLPLIAIVMLAMFAATPAAAHHAAVKASASCVEGHYVIDWRALSWVATDGTTEDGRSAAPWRGLNQKPGITISYRLGSHGHIKKVAGVHTLTAARTTGVVIKGKTRQFPSASGSFDLPGSTKGKLLLRVKAGPWGPNPANGRYESHGFSNSGYFATIRLKGDCRSESPDPTPDPHPPAEPGASAASACVGTAAVIRVALTNDNVSGGDPFAFAVTSPATGTKPSFNRAVTVPAHDATSVDVPVDENGTRVVTAAGTGFSRSFTLTGDCVANAQPSASAASNCANGVGAIRVTLANTTSADGESVTFEVASLATGSQPAYSLAITLNGGDVRTLDVPVDEDTERTVAVAAPGMSTESFTETVDCYPPGPVASAFAFCDGDVFTIVMIVANEHETGGESILFTIDLEGAGSQPALHQTVLVPAGGSQELIEIADEGTTRAGTINAPGMATLDFVFGASCIEG